MKLHSLNIAKLAGLFIALAVSAVATAFEVNYWDPVYENHHPSQSGKSKVIREMSSQITDLSSVKLEKLERAGSSNLLLPVVVNDEVIVYSESCPQLLPHRRISSSSLVTPKPTAMLNARHELARETLS